MLVLIEEIEAFVLNIIFRGLVPSVVKGRAYQPHYV